MPIYVIDILVPNFVPNFYILFLVGEQKSCMSVLYALLVSQVYVQRAFSTSQEKQCVTYAIIINAVVPTG